MWQAILDTRQSEPLTDCYWVQIILVWYGQIALQNIVRKSIFLLLSWGFGRNYWLLPRDVIGWNKSGFILNYVLIAVVWFWRTCFSKLFEAGCLTRTLTPQDSPNWQNTFYRISSFSRDYTSETHLMNKAVVSPCFFSKCKRIDPEINYSHMFSQVYLRLKTDSNT